MNAQVTADRIAASVAPNQPSADARELIIFIGLQCLDLLTTLAVFAHGGVELNPVVHALMPWMGRLPAIVVSKVILVSLVLLLNRRRRILHFANLLYTGIVTWNVMILLALR